MELEDYYHQAAGDTLVLCVMVADRDRQIAELTERLNRMTVALDDALYIIRDRNAKDAALKAEAEALEL
jgi:hypothetical protein